MELINSFQVDHINLKRGIYLSRVDGSVKTYDVRLRIPYKDKILTNEELHSFEHFMATVLRSGVHKDGIVYVGPMGCQTGFYIVVKNYDMDDMIYILRKSCKLILKLSEVPGNLPIQCGNNSTLNTRSGHSVANELLEVLNKNICTEYPIKAEVHA